MKSFQDILQAAKGHKPARLATPLKEQDVDLICRAAGSGYIVPLLLGDGDKLEEMIAGTPLPSLEHEIVHEKDPAAMLDTAFSMIREKRADILMQGTLGPNELTITALGGKTGLLTGRLASYVSVFELPESGKLILMTDTFLNDYPNISEKQAILENALSLSAVLEMDTPKVAVLAAIEQVNPGIPSTLDAAILSKMSDRGQFGKAVVEGPLDIDCSLSHVAAERKGIRSSVTGNVDIYLVPEIDTGYLLAEALVCIGRISTAGMVMGTAGPVILDVPFISDNNRLVEIALASLLVRKGERHG